MARVLRCAYHFERGQWVPIAHAAGLSLAYLAPFRSALSNFMDGCILSRLGPIVISPHMNLTPVVSLRGRAFLPGKTLIRDQNAGGALILAGVLIVHWKQCGRSDELIRQPPSRG